MAARAILVLLPSRGRDKGGASPLRRGAEAHSIPGGGQGAGGGGALGKCERGKEHPHCGPAHQQNFTKEKS